MFSHPISITVILNHFCSCRLLSQILDFILLTLIAIYKYVRGSADSHLFTHCVISILRSPLHFPVWALMRSLLSSRLNTLSSESRCVLRLQYIHLVVSIEVAVGVCLIS
jgi:hypothetical protein